jgi:hypothetical protein
MVVTETALADIEEGGTHLLLAGTASDGAGVSSVMVLVYTPEGQIDRKPAEWDGLNWQFPLGPDMDHPGTFVMRVEATDINGNIAIAGPFNFTITGGVSVYLPIILK